MMAKPLHCEKMAHTPLSKNMLTEPQCLGIQEKERVAIKEKRSYCHVNEEEEILMCDE